MFDPVWILKQPWFAVSPSPWSFAFYILMGVIGARLLLRAGVPYKRAPRLIAFLDAVFILGMVVFLQDSIWLVMNTWRWILPYYMGTATFTNYWIRFPQNIVGALLLLLVTSGLWQLKYVRLNRKFWFWISLIVIYTGIVFALAPSQGFTDWVFAVAYGYSDQVILEAFLISHVGYKLLIALAFLSLFNMYDNRTALEDSSNNFKKGAVQLERHHGSD